MDGASSSYRIVHRDRYFFELLSLDVYFLNWFSLHGMQDGSVHLVQFFFGIKLVVIDCYAVLFIQQIENALFV